MKRTTAVLIYLCLFEIIIAFDNDHCPDGWFSCKNGQCISNMFVCDGEDECGNGLDEIDCRDRSKIYESHKCPAKHYKCNQSMTCIPERWICDGHRDCPNDDDEAHCDNVHCDGFLCQNKECIPKRWRCDQTKDCADGSDEVGCLVKPVFDCTLQNGKFQCITGECINLTKFCDNHTDCSKGDDEGPFCQVDPCSSYGCSDKCVNTPNGPRCLCPHGFQIDTSQGGDDKKCEDINECAENPAHLCSHQCTNTYGSYHCSCLTGYALAPNNRTCNATGSDPILYFTDSISIRAYNPRRKLYWQVRKAFSKAMGIDALVNGERLFWTEYDEKRAAVFSSTTKGENLTAVIAMGLRRPEDVAFDWVAHNIYITDSDLRSIIACKYEEVICKVIIKQGEGFLLRGIVVAPKEGLMYWTDWGSQLPGIYAASMDGSDKRALVTKDIQWPEGLTLDETTYRLYWTDGKKKTVEYYNTLMDSRNILIPGGTYHPFAVAVFEDNLYWSDSAINVINVDNKFTGHNHSVLTARSHFTSFGMVVFHELRQPVIRNRCFGSQCSHLCLLRPGGYSCACPKHLMLKRDGKTCIPNRNDSYFMIIMDGTVKKLYPEAIGKDVIMELDVPPMINISTFAYNKDNDTFYVVSSNAQQLYALRKTKPKIRLIANYTQSVIRRIIYDSHSTNLYLLDSKKGAVKVIREVNNDSGYEEAIVLQDLESARDFVLDQKHSLMFVALSEPDPHILMSAMDGTNPKKLFIKHLGVPSALYMDQHSNRLFFADSKKGTIEAVFLGKKYEEQEYTTAVIHKNLGEVTSLAVWDDLLYWTKKEGRKLMHSHMNQPNMVSTMIPNEHHHPLSAVDLVVSMVSDVVKSKCQDNNGGCSHFCLVSEGRASCRCPTGLSIAPNDRKKCIEAPPCGRDEWACLDSECIVNSFLCDGTIDCKDKSDELFCQHRCTESEFECDNQKCVPKSWRCDTVNDCGDNSDERNCSTVKCPAGRFACGNNQCISMDKRCDNKMDCFNHRDEEVCKSFKCKANNKDFVCDDGYCVTKNLVCDGHPDCSNGKDELNCTCEPSQFRCENNNCVDKESKCNDEDDCGDGSDERDCSDGYVNDAFAALDTKDSSSTVSCKPDTCANGAYCVIKGGRPQCRCPDGSYGNCGKDLPSAVKQKESRRYWWILLFLPITMLIAIVMFIKYYDPFNKMYLSSMFRRDGLREVVVSYKNQSDMRQGLIDSEDLEKRELEPSVEQVKEGLNQESQTHPDSPSDFGNPGYGKVIRANSEKNVNNFRKWPSNESTMSTDYGDSSSSDLQSLTTNSKKRDGISFFVR